jgi:hypothetical protein
MRIKRISPWVLAAMVAFGTPSMAGAAITQLFSSRADFVAGTSGLTSLNYNLGPSYDAPSYTVGSLTITAPGSNLFGAGDVASTEFDNNSLVLTFATPVTALGLFGGVTDEFFDYVNGTLNVSLNGGATASLTANGGTAAYLGFISDVAISRVELTIGSFDTNATSTAFVTLAQQADLASASSTGSVPEPATWMMMIVGFGVVGSTLRRVSKLAPVRSGA